MTDALLQVVHAPLTAIALTLAAFVFALWLYRRTGWLVLQPVLITMLLIIAGFPSALISIFFTGSLLIEVIFSLDGLGLLGFEAAINRDYPVMFGTLYIFTLVGLVVKLIGDIAYTLVDPRIDFSSREG